MSVKEKEVIAWLSERKLMPSPELVSHISNHPEGLGLLERTVTSLSEPKLFLGISDLIEEEKAETPNPIERKKVTDIPPVIIERQIQKSMSDGKLESYVSLFNDRFNNLSKLVRRDPSMRDAIRDTSNLSPDEENKIIGMVADIQTFNNGRTLGGPKHWENCFFQGVQNKGKKFSAKVIPLKFKKPKFKAGACGAAIGSKFKMPVAQGDPLHRFKVQNAPLKLAHRFIGHHAVRTHRI